MAKKNKKESKVQVVDKTGEDAPTVKVSDKLKNKVEGMSAAEKAAFAAELGLPVKKIREPKEKEPTQTDRFNEADARLAEQIDSIRTILDGCEFPGGFALTIGVDHAGKPFARTKQVRAPYGPRNKDKNAD